MNPRERVLAAMRREQPDRVPFQLSFTPPMYKLFKEKTEATDAAEYWNFDTRFVEFNLYEAAKTTKADYSHYYPEDLPPGTILNPWGIAEAPGSMHHFVRMIHPLRAAQTVKEIVEYPLPNLVDQVAWQHLAEQVAGYQMRNLATIGGLETTVFEISWYLRGMETVFNDMMTQPDLVQALFDRITQLRIFQAETYARVGVDILDLGDDIATQRGMLMSPRMWREWLKPRLARVIDAARAINPNILIWYHTDGDCRAIIPELIEIGVDILNPLQPECMDPVEIKLQFGDRLAFAGTIGTQTTMPFGTADDIKAIVRERITTVGKGGGLLLAPTHVLEPDVPWENAIAFIEAVQAN